MDKQELYNNIIQNRINNPLDKETYGEYHHIIPRCLGGSNLKKNIVKLTAREHFIVHYLLSEMYKPNTFKWYKMNHAFLMMKCISTGQETRYINSRLYELKRIDVAIAMSENQRGICNSQFGTCWIHNYELRQSKKCKITELDDYISSGWSKGRVIDFDLKERVKKQREEKIRKRKTDRENKNISFRELNKEFIFNNVLFTSQMRNTISKYYNINLNDLNINFLETIMKLKSELEQYYNVDNMSTITIGKIYGIVHWKINCTMKFLGIQTRKTYSHLLT